MFHLNPNPSPPLFPSSPTGAETPGQVIALRAALGVGGDGVEQHGDPLQFGAEPDATFEVLVGCLGARRGVGLEHGVEGFRCGEHPERGEVVGGIADARVLPRRDRRVDR